MDNEEQRQEFIRRQNEGMSAMSNEEMDRMQYAHEKGMRNAYPELTSWQLAQGSQKWWAMVRGEVEVPPIKAPDNPTLWARIRRWLSS